MVKIAFFGTPAFAVPTLLALLASGHRVVVVVTQPDRPRGRGQRVGAPPAKQAALAHGVPVLQPERLRDTAFLQALGQYGVDLAVVVAYGRVLPAELLALPSLGFLNVHASLLPRYRGAAPVHRAILAGESETGVTIMRVVQALDAGPILASDVRRIGPDETSDEVERDLARRGASLLLETVEAFKEGSAHERPQDERVATYAPRLVKRDGLIDWSRPARRIHDQVRGVWPWPHAYTYLGGERLQILRTAVTDLATHARHPGDVFEARGDGLLVAAGDGMALRMLEVQPAGRRAMPMRDFLAGHHVVSDARFLPNPSSSP